MKNNKGFTVIELMISITITATIVITIISSFSKLYGFFVYNTKFLSVNQELNIAMDLIEKDVQDAGVFGPFSFHNQSSNNFNNISMSSSASNCGNSSTNDFTQCNFDTSTVGVKSYESQDSATISNLVSSSFKIKSDILKVQYGNIQPSPLYPLDVTNKNSIISKCQNGPQSGFYLNYLNFPNTTTDLDPTYPFFILASSNHAYLLQGNKGSQILDSTKPPYNLNMNNNANGCPQSVTNGISAIPTTILLGNNMVEGNSLKYDSTDPDIHTMSLVNLYTKYYFVGQNGNESGLYMVYLQPDMKLSTPELISSAVSGMNVEFVLDNSINFNKVKNGLLGRFTNCSTKQMSSRGEIRCSGNWNKVVNVNITLTGGYYQQKSDYIEIKFTSTMGWLS